MILSTLPPAPGQVTGLAATGVNKQVLLGWYAPGSGATPNDYLVEYKLSSDGAWSTFSDGVSTTLKATVTGLTNASIYNFKVTALNDGSPGTASSTATATPDAISTLSFVIAGESNSGGIGVNSSATAGELAPRSAVQILELTSGNFLFENLDIGTNNLRDHAGLGGYYDTSHGLELQLANSTEENAFPDNPQIYLIKTGQGGSQVSQWNYAGGYFTKFLQRTTAAKTQIPSNRKWVVWMSIGINDGIAGTNINTFKTDLTTYINNIKTDLPGAIIIMTQFQSMPAGSGYPTINTALAEVAAAEPNVYVVNTAAATNTDGANHWLYSGLKSVASSMVVVTKTAMGLNYPGLVTSLNATPSTTSTALSWTAPISNGGSAITDYVIEFKLAASSTWTTFADGTSTTTSATVTGLSDSSEYNFRVSAANSSGTGNTVSTSASTTDGTAPSISTVVSTPSATSTSITWTTNESASSKVDYGLTNSYGSTTSETNTSPRVTSHSVTLSSLVPCTTYHYRVRSRDGVSNESLDSVNTFTTTGCTGSAAVASQSAATIATAAGGSINLVSGDRGIALTIPVSFAGSDADFQIKSLDKAAVNSVTSVPANYSGVGTYFYDLKALSGISTSISSFANPITVSVTYGASDIVGIDESSLKIYRWDGSAWNVLTGCIVTTSTKTVSCGTSNFSVFGLFGEPIVLSSPSQASSNSSAITSTSPKDCQDQAPGAKAPWLYGAIAQTSSSALLYFTAADNPVDTYVLTYGTKSGEYKYGVSDLGINSRGQMTYLVQSLSPNTTYYFRVRGGNGCATGNWSNEISVKTKGLVAFNQIDFSQSKLESKSNPEINGTSKSAEEVPQGYIVNVKVLDKNKKPVAGAKVTIHSKVQEAITNKEGVVEFKNVEQGEHKVFIAYDNFEGQQTVNLTGDVKQFDLSVTVQQKSILLSPLVYIVGGVLGVAIIVLLIKLNNAKKKK